MPPVRVRPFPCRTPLRAAGLALAAALLALPAAQAAKPAAPKAQPAELQPETLTTAVIDAKYGARVYVPDLVLPHINDGRIRVFDSLGGKFLGMVSTGYVGNFALSDKRDALYVATTHLSRSVRGERADVLEVYDTQTLGFQYEVLLPPKRAQALNYRGLVRVTANGRFVLVQNATPATSVTVVDLAAKKVAAEVPTPGCWGVWPAVAHPSRFSMLCGDGSVATVTLDDAGQPAERQATAKVFDGDTDPWFHHAEQVGDKTYFISFQGKLATLDLNGAVAKVVAQQDFVSAAEKKAGWRPGGYQPFAIDPSGRTMVVSMHPKGTEGSHKTPAAALWFVDVASGRHAGGMKGDAAVALTFSRNGERLATIDGEKGALRSFAWNGGKPKLLASVPSAGETVTLVESHD